MAEAGAVVTTPRSLMAAADRLTGVHTGMTSDEIREAQATATTSVLWARYLIDKYKGLHASAERGETWEAMLTLATENPEVTSLIKQAFPDRVFRPAKSGRPVTKRKFA